MKHHEDSILIRRADPRDAESLAHLHFNCALAQPGGFMHRLGQKFFVKYYQILLGEHMTVILCADAGRDGIVGLVSATLDSKRQLDAIRKGRFKLLLAVIPVLIRRPSLIWEIYVRNRSLSARSPGDEYVVSSGARIAYWGGNAGSKHGEIGDRPSQPTGGGRAPSHGSTCRQGLGNERWKGENRA